MKTYSFSLTAERDGSFVPKRLDPQANGFLVDAEILFESPTPNSLTVGLVSPAGNTRTLISNMVSSGFLGLAQVAVMPPQSMMTFTGNSIDSAEITVVLYYV